MLYVKSLRGRNLENSTSSKSTRELRCLAATAIDAARFPILAAHWPGLLIVDGRLACHDNAPIRNRFKTMPGLEIMDPAHASSGGAQ